MSADLTPMAEAMFLARREAYDQGWNDALELAARLLDKDAYYAFIPGAFAPAVTTAGRIRRMKRAHTTRQSPTDDEDRVVRGNYG